MRVLAWLRDWAIIAACPWFAIYLLWHGPIILGILLILVLVAACASRLSH